jgi:methylated-DNA-protein-cysteine methyltransferase-like protein
MARTQQRGERRTEKNLNRLNSDNLSPFSKSVISKILKIPKGKVATYGQIAKLAGNERGARGVSWILNSCSRAYKLPWHRVLGSSGKISFHPMSSDYLKQKKVLKAEGVIFDELDRIDLIRFGWKDRSQRD